MATLVGYGLKEYIKLDNFCCLDAYFDNNEIIETLSTKQFLYKLEHPSSSNHDVIKL